MYTTKYYCVFIDHLFREFHRMTDVSGFRYILVASLDEKTRRNNITIYDLRNKFISFAGQIAADERVALVTHDGGIAYILTASQLLIRYRERDTLSKIEVLLKKSLYQLAISLGTLASLASLIHLLRNSAIMITAFIVVDTTTLSPFLCCCW